MSSELRASLWNALHISLWDRPLFIWKSGMPGPIAQFAKTLWYQHFKVPFSTIPSNPAKILENLEKHFFTCGWSEVYDFLEAVLAIRGEDQIRRALSEVLERELAPYRLIANRFVEITDEKELAALDEALQATGKFAACADHFQRALELLSDRASPDFRNSVKESISAVEAAARIVTGQDGATLGDALKVLERHHQLHKALKDGFSKLYGYTSDEQGIRHAMLEEPSLGMAEAKYFLLSCTSFVNYLKGRLDQDAG